MNTINVDVLVCGGGMSGMSCAAFAAESGAKVLVAEKLDKVGGSSNYSAGMFWAPRNYASLRSWVPDGEPELQQAFLNDYLPAVEWMRQSGVPTAKRFDGIMTIGIGFPINIPHLHALHQQRIESSKTGSQVWTDTSVIALIQEHPGLPGSRVTGAVVRRGENGYTKVNAKLVVLATGGFQGNNQLRSQHIGLGADNVFVRSNPGSVGDGLQFAGLIGAGTSRGMNTFYGHLLAAPLRAEDVDPKDFLSLAQYQSKYCLLINESGRRFADETIGDEIINQYLYKQEKRRGFLLFNENTRAKHCVSALFPNAGDIDRLEKARSYGCRVASAQNLNELARILDQWGVNGKQALFTINQYDNRVRLGNKDAILDAPTGKVGSSPPPLVDGNGPFFAMEVQPSITFTYGGISVDSRGNALTPNKQPIPGLLVAGVDGGGFSNLGYTGGLSLAFITGIWAARRVAEELRLPEPKLPAANPNDLMELSRL